MKKNDCDSWLQNLNLSNEKLAEIALETGFIVRERLISPSGFLSAVCKQAAQGTASCNDIAAHMDRDKSPLVSRQAIWKKVNAPCELFFKKILALVISNKLTNEAIEIIKIKSNYTRILVQDSTIIKLPIRLFPDFSGVSNGHTQVCNARIQCTYDLLSETFVAFSIDPYSKNDLKAAPELVLKEGDLVLRDRGYLINDEIQRHMDSSAHCIYRYKFNMVFLDPKTEKPIDILPILRKNKCLDMRIMLNNESKTIVRIVACPVSKEVAGERKTKAKKENKKAPSKEYLELLSWSIYITTITNENIGYPYIYQAYSLRWRIEIIFKCWKSNIAFDKIHNVSLKQLNVLVVARLIMIIICSQLIFTQCKKIVKANFKKDLSMLKLTKCLLRNTGMIADIMDEIHCKEIGKSITALAKYCTYDIRKRLNYQQKIEGLLA